MNSIGIMQGRLSPPNLQNPQRFPVERWEEEFQLARTLGFDNIEWLFDSATGEDNPILTNQGRKIVKRLMKKNSINISSICADYFKDFTLAVSNDSLLRQRTDLLVRLITETTDLGVVCVLIPFLEASTLQDAQSRKVALEALKYPLDVAEKSGMTLAFETDMPADVINVWLSDMGHPSAGVYYDLGNAVASGYDPVEEIDVLKRWIRGVHIKDRTRNGPNVALGSGAVNFPLCLEKLRETKYEGAYILETVRGEHFIDDAKKNLSYLEIMLGTG